MANQAGQLTVTLAGSSSSLTGAGLGLTEGTDGAPINPVNISVLDSTGEWVDDGGTTDTVWLETSEGAVKQLTRHIPYYTISLSPDDLNTAGLNPGSTKTVTAWIVVRRQTGSAPSSVETIAQSASFPVTITKQRTFSPSMLASANCIGWFSSMDGVISALADNTSIASWVDMSASGRDLSEATNQPRKKTKGNKQQPYVNFDGVNDVLTSVLADAGLACTVAALVKFEVTDATKRTIIKIGGANGLEIGSDSTNIYGRSGSDVASTPRPADGTWYVVVGTKAAGGAVTIQKNRVTAVSTASSAVVTPGAVQVGGGSNFPNADVIEFMVFDGVLNAADIERAVLYLAGVGQVIV